MERRTHPPPPCQALEDCSCQVPFARTQLDEVMATRGLQSLLGPRRHGLAQRGGQHGSGGEVPASSDAPDAACIVAAFRVMERPIHEAVEPELPVVAVTPWPKRGIHRRRLDGWRSLSHVSRG